MAEWSGGSGSRDGGGFRKGYPLGEWKERITIQRSSLGNDKAGNHVLVWEDYFCCSAFVNSLSEVAGMDTEHYRILFRGQVYDLVFIDNVRYQNRTLKLRASLVKR